MTDRESTLNVIVGMVLLVGASAGMVAMAVGAGLGLSGHPLQASADRSPLAVFGGAVALQPADLMGAGILILMATPVFGVVTLVLGFLCIGRYRFALISLLVLLLLVISFVFVARA